MGAYPLQDGEQVLWSGWPQRQQRWFYEHTVLLVIGVAVIAWIVLAEARGGSSFLSSSYLGIIVLVAVYFQRLKTRRAWARAISYQVTSQRIIFTAHWPAGTEVRWVWLGPLSSPKVHAGADGVGTVTFGIGLLTRSQLRATELNGAWAPFVPELRKIPDAQQVAGLIARLQWM